MREQAVNMILFMVVGMTSIMESRKLLPSDISTMSRMAPMATAYFPIILPFAILFSSEDVFIDSISYAPIYYNIFMVHVPCSQSGMNHRAVKSHSSHEYSISGREKSILHVYFFQFFGG